MLGTLNRRWLDELFIEGIDRSDQELNQLSDLMKEMGVSQMIIKILNTPLFHLSNDCLGY